MPRFFIENLNSIDTFGNITIGGDEAKHIAKVLRMKIGEEIVICDKMGSDYLCKIDSVSSEVVCKIIEKVPTKTEPNVNLTVYQAVPKLDKLDLIIQKSVELGATTIVPFLSKRCVSRPDEKSAFKKVERWNKIALEAAKQSGRGIIPTVTPIISMEKAVEKTFAENDITLICYEDGGENFAKVGLAEGQNIGLFIGSEGGFELSEVEKVTQNAGVKIGMGERILRCETAVISSISIIMHLTGNM